MNKEKKMTIENMLKQLDAIMPEEKALKKDIEEVIENLKNKSDIQKMTFLGIPDFNDFFDPESDCKINGFLIFQIQIL